MIRFLPVSFIVISSFALAGTPEAAAQSPDRAELLLKIESLRGQLETKESRFLAPSADDLAAYSEFLKQPDTGMARIMPREKYEGNLLIRGGGAYYSFAKVTNEYGFGSDIGLAQSKFLVGFVGANFGFLTSLGNIAIDSITADETGVQYLVSFNTPSLEPGARAEQRRAREGFQVEGFGYRDYLDASVDTTYALRSVNYGFSDLLVVFRVTRHDTDGSMILVWKILKKYPVPRLAS